MDSSVLTKLGVCTLAFNSALAVYNSWGDAASVASVLAALALLLHRQLRQFERVHGGRGGHNDGGGRINNNKGAALATLAVAALLCSTALQTYGARRDAAAAAVVLLSYVILLALTGVFLAGFARAHHGGQQGRAGEGALALLEEELKAMFASGVAALVPPVVAAAVWAVAVATVGGGFWAFFAPQ